MGVKGLLQALRPVARDSCLSDFAGQSAAIDGYAWLHKAAFTAVENVVNRTFTDKPTRYVLRKIAMVRSYGVRPIVVLDGRPLPSKEKTNFARHASREASKADAKRLAAQGDSAGAYKAMGQAISITWQMVEHLLCQLHSRGIEFIVAPYEADAQLGYLSRTGYVDFVISEDSDLILYGCRKVFFKLDDAGRGLVIDSNDLPSANLLPLTLYSHDALIQLCSLAGCDYSDGIKGLGLKKGGKILGSFLAKEKAAEEDAADEDRKPTTPLTRITRLTKEINAHGFVINEQITEDLRKAYLTFKYQAVYDPVTHSCVRNHTLPSHIPENDFMGPILNAQETDLICSGKAEPKSMKPSALAQHTTSSRSTANCRTTNVTPLITTKTQLVRSDRTGSDATEISTITSFFRVQSPTAKKKKRKIKQAITVDSDVTPNKNPSHKIPVTDLSPLEQGIHDPPVSKGVVESSKENVEFRLEFGPRVSLQPLSSDPDDDEVPVCADSSMSAVDPICSHKPIGAGELNKLFEDAKKKPARAVPARAVSARDVPTAAENTASGGGQNAPPVAPNIRPARRSSMTLVPQSPPAAVPDHQPLAGKRHLDHSENSRPSKQHRVSGGLNDLFAASMLTKRRRASEQFRNENITF